MGRLARICLLASVLVACGETNGPDTVERGRRVYVSNCIACHHVDPRLPGGVGPAVAGSSLELVYARVVEGTYPPGYEPQRGSALMPAQPYLEPNVADLAAYLQSVEPLDGPDPGD